MTNHIPYNTILAARAGESDALAAIIRHYTPYIVSFSKRPFYDEYGNRYELVDEEIRKRIENRLMFQIVYKFDPAQLPKGECLDAE